MLRQQGVFSLRELKDLYLEPGGTVSLKKYAKSDNVTPEMLGLNPKDEPLNFLFIDEGEINEGILNYVGKSKKWLHDELTKEGYANIQEILYAEWTESDGLFIKTYSENEENNASIRKGN